MASDLRDTYLERTILEADNCRLVLLLYQRALEALQTAREHLSRGEIRERSVAITRVSEILNELSLSVNHEVGGEISRNLVELYDYLQRLLQKANAEQVEPPLIEAQSLLETLIEAWRSCEPALLPQSALPQGSDTPLEYSPVNVTG